MANDRNAEQEQEIFGIKVDTPVRKSGNWSLVISRHHQEDQSE